MLRSILWTQENPVVPDGQTGELVIARALEWAEGYMKLPEKADCLLLT